MADPVTIVAIVNGSFGLALKCAKVAKDLHDLAEKYKHAELAILSMVEECEVIQLAWSRIQGWCQGWADDASCDHQLLGRLNQSLIVGTMVMSALEKELPSSSEDTDSRVSTGFRWRSKVVWNETAFQIHQDRIRGQVGALNLLLQVIKLPSIAERNDLLGKAKDVFRDSDESAWTTVQSRASTSIRDTHSRKSIDSAELVYRRLSFEDDLFTAKVYKRNYRNPKMGELFQGIASNSAKTKENDYYLRPALIQAQELKQDSERPDLPASQQAASCYDASTILRLLAKSHVSTNHEDNVDTLPLSSLGSDKWHLDFALSQNRFDFRDTLLKPSMKHTDGWMHEKLFEACRQGNECLIDFLVDRGMSARCRETPSSILTMGPTALHVAAIHGQIEAARTLLRRGARIFDTRTGGRQPLHEAASAGHGPMTTFLLHEGASVSARDESGYQPIHVASQVGSLEVVSILLEAGAAVDCVGNDRYQPLHHVSQECDNSHLIIQLVRNGANIEAETNFGYRPLQLACKSGHSAVVQTLLSVGAEVNVGEGKCGHSELATPVALAKDRGSIKPKRELPSKGANVNASNSSTGMTAIHFAHNVTIMKILLHHGANVRASDHEGNQALHHVTMSVMLSNEEPDSSQVEQLIELLLNHGADINAKNNRAECPLSMAAKHLKPWLVRIYLKRRMLNTFLSLTSTVHGLTYSQNGWGRTPKPSEL
ncbi:MAG: hypothetical protein M1830_002897 [Pleopsidium flavum]|nr:MAG: hypothetical protein M1830_002897 [Pleopsidium flavum]